MAMQDYIKHFVRESEGVWVCVEPAELHISRRRIQIAAGTRFTVGGTFMGVELARLLEEEHARHPLHVGSYNVAMQDSQSALQAQDAELLSLGLGARIAYFQLTMPRRQVSLEEDLTDLVHLVAIALSTVAPILRSTGERLDDRALREELYPRPGSPRPDLEGLVIRRGDLRNAIATLKEARVAFGKPGL
jgi:hypothetical protein